MANYFNKERSGWVRCFILVIFFLKYALNLNRIASLILFPSSILPSYLPLNDTLDPPVESLFFIDHYFTYVKYVLKHVRVYVNMCMHKCISIESTESVFLVFVSMDSSRATLYWIINKRTHS